MLQNKMFILGYFLLTMTLNHCTICYSLSTSLHMAEKPQLSGADCDAIKLHHSVYVSACDVKMPPILIFHGLLGSTRNFQTWGKLLSKSLPDRDIICVDLRNHGRSANSAAHPACYELMAADVKLTMDSLNIDTAHLVGHSMGGKVAAACALRKDMLERIISVSILDISPVHYEPEDFVSVTSTVGILMELIEPLAILSSRKEAQALLDTRFTDSNLVSFLMSNIQPSPRGGIGFNWKFNIRCIHESLPSIRSFPASPTRFPGKALIVKAAKSSFVRSTHIPQITSLFPAYNLATVRDAGHWLHAEKPQQTVDLVEKFLRSV